MVDVAAYGIIGIFGLAILAPIVALLYIFIK